MKLIIHEYFFIKLNKKLQNVKFKFIRYILF